MRSSTSVSVSSVGRTRQTAESIENIVGNMTPQLRSRIIEDARRLRGSRLRGGYDTSRTISKSLHLPEAVVAEVIFTQLEAVESELATVRTGIFSALQMGKEASQAVWLEKRGAA